MLIRIKKGLDLPVAGTPLQVIEAGRSVQSVALIGADHPGLKPTLHVSQGQRVKLGELLFTDKSSAVAYTAPGCGIISHIHRGHRHSLESIVVQLDGNDEEVFSAFPRHALAALSAEVVRHQLQRSGLWSALRSRPFNRPPKISSQPDALFVTAMDSNALAADPALIIAHHKEDFIDGLTVVSRLADVPVFVCKAAGADIPLADHGTIKVVEFSGPHPAGLVGTHIHFLFPVSGDRCVWHLHYQDVIAIGKLFSSGRLWIERIISLAGPQVQRPRLIRSRMGASVNDLVEGELKPGENRIISGPLLCGRHARQAHAWLGRYHLQLGIIEEYHAAEHAQRPTFSVNRLVPAWLRRQAPRSFTTAMHGQQRPLLPLGNFEKVMPLDILPTPLLKALLVGDLETALDLGCLELDEEDLSLCSFVCCSKLDYAAALRRCLSSIEAAC